MDAVSKLLDIFFKVEPRPSSSFNEWNSGKVGIRKAILSFRRGLVNSLSQGSDWHPNTGQTWERTNRTLLPMRFDGLRSYSPSVVLSSFKRPDLVQIIQPVIRVSGVIAVRPPLVGQSGQLLLCQLYDCELTERRVNFLTYFEVLLGSFKGDFLQRGNDERSKGLPN